MDVICESSFCRLCADVKDNFLQIYDAEGHKLAIGAKIYKCLQIQVNEKDSLPKNICWECYSKLEQCSDFITSSQNAQITLSQKVFSVFDDETNMKEERMFPSDVSLFHQSTAIMPFTQPRMEKTSEVLTSFSFNNLNMPDSNSGCFFDKPTTCMFEEGNRNISNVSLMPSDMDTTTNTNINAVNCNQVASHLRKKPNKKKNSIDERIPTNNLHTTRYKKKLTRKKKSVLSRKKCAGHFLDEDEHDEIDSVSLKRKYFDNLPWLCTDCNDNFQTMKELQYHHESYHMQSLKYICPFCYKVYTQYHGFVVHMEKRLCMSEFVCNQCSKTFSTKKVLQNHLATHSDARKHHCKDCGKSFKLQSTLSTHSRCHLSSLKKVEYACDQCDKVFSTKPNLVTHKKIHIGLRNYICDLCGKGFVQKGNLCAHMLTHSNNKPFICETCNKEFKTLMQLRKHSNVHTGKKPHQCDACGRTFRERGTLKEHYRIHTGAMPFSCEFCGKAFRFKGVLTTHRRQHTGERPYSCMECQHHFTNWPNYNKHMKRRHGINKSRANFIKMDSLSQPSQDNRTSEKIMESNVAPTMELPAFEDALSPVRVDMDKSARLFDDPSPTSQLSSYLMSHENYVASSQEQNSILNAFYSLSALQMLNSGGQVVDIMDTNVHV